MHQQIQNIDQPKIVQSWGQRFGVARMEQVHVLYADELVQLDILRIEELDRLLGEKDAESIIVMAMEEISKRLTFCERAYYKQDWQGYRKTVKSMSAIGDQIGMRSLSNASKNAVDALDSKNAAAIAATFFRLQRVGDRSISDYWDLQDLWG